MNQIQTLLLALATVACVALLIRLFLGLWESSIEELNETSAQNPNDNLEEP